MLSQSLGLGDRHLRLSNKMKRFAFVMDPLEKLDLPWDTSLCLLRKLHGRGHETYLFLPSSLALESGHVTGRGRPISPAGENRYRQGPSQRLDLAAFQVVLIRKDPPFDANYLALTYLLEPLAEETFVVNHPRGIRNANEKLFGLTLPRGSPATLVSSDPEEILEFQKRLRSDLVLKPLYEKGGKGIRLLPRKGRGRLEILNRATKGKKEVWVAQQFIKVPKGTGDKRILLWKGNILGAFLRIPRRGEFRTNLTLGARFAPCRITTEERRLVRDLKSPLLKQGLDWVGIDVRGGKLIETNVTSPAGLVELDKLYGENSTATFVRDLERT